jgi:CHAT domain-containing protein
MQSLPSVALEVECVRNHVPYEALLNTSDTHGTSIEAALTHVPHADMLHLACHGHQEQYSPLDSGFDLQDGRLTLGQLMRVSATRAQFAYLSACESAGMDQSRPDEGLNLACAMIFIGFRSVIATLW